MPALGLALGLPRSQRVVAAPPAYSPADEFGAAEAGAWWDFTDLSVLWQDTAGTVPCTAAAQTVARVDDKSGNGHNLLQATAGSRPTLRQDGDSTYYLEFDGTADFLACASAGFEFMHNGDGGQLTFAGTLRSLASTVGVVLDQAFAPTGIGFLLYADTTEKLGIYSANGSAGVLNVATGNNDFPVNTNQVVTFYNKTAAGDDGVIRVDTVVQATTAQLDTPSASAATSDLHIGSFAGGALNSALNVYSMVLVERATISDDLETYMAGLYP